MNRITLKIAPSLASILNTLATDWVILEKEMPDGATIGDLLASLSSDCPGFRKVIFNPDTRTISDQVDVVLNDTLLTLPEVTGTRLKDRDNIILLTVYAGG